MMIWLVFCAILDYRLCLPDYRLTPESELPAAAVAGVEELGTDAPATARGGGDCRNGRCSVPERTGRAIFGRLLGRRR